MARCEEGYLCEICGLDVEEITDSDLYLRYVIGQVHPEQLHLLRERHIRCNPSLAQFIVHPDFAAVSMAGSPFCKSTLDGSYVEQQQELVTRGWLRLREVVQTELPIVDYPLPELRARWAD